MGMMPPCNVNGTSLPRKAAATAVEPSTQARAPAPAPAQMPVSALLPAAPACQIIKLAVLGIFMCCSTYIILVFLGGLRVCARPRAWTQIASWNSAFPGAFQLAVHYMWIHATF